MAKESLGCVAAFEAHRKDREVVRTEVIKHLREEIPPKTHVWRQVWQREPVLCFGISTCKKTGD